MSDDADEIMEDGEGYSHADLQRIGRQWIDRITAASKREEGWFKKAEEAEAAYLCDKEAQMTTALPEFNILHSNVETIVPSIYNSTPTPDIRPRSAKKDPAAKQAADLYEAAIAMQIDDNALDAEIEASAQDVFVAGRGIVRIRFDADVEDIEVVQVDPYTGEQFLATEQRVTNERLIYECVSWRDYREGAASRWEAVPWAAYKHTITHEEYERISDDALMARYPVDESEKEELDVDVWEIWCKESGRVYFVAEDSCKVLKIEDDPLGLPGFFPQAKPVQPITGTGRRTPVCPYAVYQTLAEELDRTTKRINAIMRGLKVRGAIAADADSVAAIAALGDNELAPVPNIENLIAAGGMERAVMWWPIEQSIAVLRELYVMREQTKQSIYEITGISDIIRGQGAASETATAQQIKTQWGSLRIKKMQRLIERQVRDLFVISAEIIARHFSQQSLQKMTGIQITPEMGQFIGKPLDHYRIDVESDSTVRADTSRNKGEMAEFLAGTGQFFNTMSGIIERAPETAGPIVDMYASFARQFNLGKQAEDALEMLGEMAKKAVSQPQPNPEAERMKAETEIKKAEMQMRAQENQGKTALEVEKLKLQNRNLMLDGQIKQQELGLKKGQLQLDESKAEVDAAIRAYEIDMEEDQQRAVKIGN